MYEIQINSNFEKKVKKKKNQEDLFNEIYKLYVTVWLQVKRYLISMLQRQSYRYNEATESRHYKILSR